MVVLGGASYLYCAEMKVTGSNKTAKHYLHRYLKGCFAQTLHNACQSFINCCLKRFSGKKVKSQTFPRYA